MFLSDVERMNKHVVDSNGFSMTGICRDHESEVDEIPKCEVLIGIKIHEWEFVYVLTVSCCSYHTEGSPNVAHSMPSSSVAYSYIRSFQLASTYRKSKTEQVSHKTYSRIYASCLRISSNS